MLGENVVFQALALYTAEDTNNKKQLQRFEYQPLGNFWSLLLIKIQNLVLFSLKSTRQYALLLHSEVFGPNCQFKIENSAFIHKFSCPAAFLTDCGLPSNWTLFVYLLIGH